MNCMQRVSKSFSSELFHILNQRVCFFVFFHTRQGNAQRRVNVPLITFSKQWRACCVWSPPGFVWCCAHCSQLEYEPSDSLVRMCNYTDGASLCSFCFSAFCLSLTALLLNLKQVEKERRRRRRVKKKEKLGGNTLEYPTENTASFLMVSQKHKSHYNLEHQDNLLWSNTKS